MSEYPDEDRPDPRYFMNMTRVRDGETDRPDDYLPGTNPFAEAERKKEKAKKKFACADYLGTTRSGDWLGGSSPTKPRRSWRVKEASPTKDGTKGEQMETATTPGPQLSSPHSFSSPVRRWKPPPKDQSIPPPWMSPSSDSSKQSKWKGRTSLGPIPPPVNKAPSALSPGEANLPGKERKATWKALSGEEKPDVPTSTHALEEDSRPPRKRLGKSHAGAVVDVVPSCNAKITDTATKAVHQVHNVQHGGSNAKSNFPLMVDTGKTDHANLEQNSEKVGEDANGSKQEEVLVSKADDKEEKEEEEEQYEIDSDAEQDDAEENSHDGESKANDEDGGGIEIEKKEGQKGGSARARQGHPEVEEDNEARGYDEKKDLDDGDAHEVDSEAEEERAREDIDGADFEAEREDVDSGECSENKNEANDDNTSSTEFALHMKEDFKAGGDDEIDTAEYEETYEVDSEAEAEAAEYEETYEVDSEAEAEAAEYEEMYEVDSEAEAAEYEEMYEVDSEAEPEDGREDAFEVNSEAENYDIEEGNENGNDVDENDDEAFDVDSVIGRERAGVSVDDGEGYEVESEAEGEREVYGSASLPDTKFQQNLSVDSTVDITDEEPSEEFIEYQASDVEVESDDEDGGTRCPSEYGRDPDVEQPAKPAFYKDPLEGCAQSKPVGHNEAYPDDDRPDPREFMVMTKVRDGDTERPDDYLPGTDPFADIRRKKEKAKKKYASADTTGKSRVDDWLGSGKPQRRSWQVKGTN